MAAHDYFPFLRRPAPKFVTEKGDPVYGFLAHFDTPQAVYAAAEQVRDAGYSEWDVYAPFPIHGIDEAMGVKRTKLPLLTAAVAFGVGTVGAFGLQYWVAGVTYPLTKQGKPYAAWEPFMPVGFELSVLFAAFATLIGMLALNGLPRFYHPLFRKDRFLGVSQDAYAICVEAGDPKFHPEETRRMLQQLGAKDVELVEDP